MSRHTYGTTIISCVIVLSMPGCRGTVAPDETQLEDERFFQNASIAMLQNAALKGDAEAQCWLAWRHVQGLGVKKNERLGMAWAMRAVSQDHLGGAHVLGWIHDHGLGVPEDPKQAAKLYEQAAKRGHGLSALSLANLHATGRGVKKSPKKAFKWTRRAAEAGNAWAQYYLADMYANGFGTEQDDEEAVTWYMRSSEQTGPPYVRNPDGIDMIASPAAMSAMRLYVLHSEGRGVEADSFQAEKWLRRAADLDYPPAKQALRKMEQESTSP